MVKILSGTPNSKHSKAGGGTKYLETIIQLCHKSQNTTVGTNTLFPPCNSMPWRVFLVEAGNSYMGSQFSLHAQQANQTAQRTATILYPRKMSNTIFATSLVNSLPHELRSPSTKTKLKKIYNTFMLLQKLERDYGTEKIYLLNYS